jgi:hypothetical protein
MGIRALGYLLVQEEENAAQDKCPSDQYPSNNNQAAERSRKISDTTRVACQTRKRTKIPTYTETMNSSPKMDSTVEVKHYNVSINRTWFLYRNVQSKKKKKNIGTYRSQRMPGKALLLRRNSKQSAWNEICQGVQNINITALCIVEEIN